MKNKSPLRYPGGKTRAIPILQKYIDQFPTRKRILSPFLGGGSFELHLLSQGYTVYGNDLFGPLTTFWNIVKTNPSELQQNVQNEMPVTKEKFKQFRDAILEETDPMKVATMQYIINRCSFSGSTFCGGYSSQAAEGRLNQSALQTITNVVISNLTISNESWETFLQDHPEHEDTLVYADPPYQIETYLQGKDGDLHETFDHVSFAETIQKRKDWILCYNDCLQIRELQKNCRIESVSWSQGMNKTKKSSEIIIQP